MLLRVVRAHGERQQRGGAGEQKGAAVHFHVGGASGAGAIFAITSDRWAGAGVNGGSPEPRGLAAVDAGRRAPMNFIADHPIWTVLAMLAGAGLLYLVLKPRRKA